MDLAAENFVAKLITAESTRLCCVWVRCLRRTTNSPQSREKNIPELKDALQIIRNELSLETMHKSPVSFRKRLQACVKADGFR